MNNLSGLNRLTTGLLLASFLLVPSLTSAQTDLPPKKWTGKLGERKKWGKFKYGVQSLASALHQKLLPNHGANAHSHDLELIDDRGRPLRHTVSLPDFPKISPGFFRSPISQAG
jgi:hypothetical protein